MKKTNRGKGHIGIVCGFCGEILAKTDNPNISIRELGEQNNLTLCRISCGDIRETFYICKSCKCGLQELLHSGNIDSYLIPKKHSTAINSIYYYK